MEPIKIYYPDKEIINFSDPDIQRDLILRGIAVGIPGGEFYFKKNVELIAGPEPKGEK
jgi:hypothetical protein